MRTPDLTTRPRKRPAPIRGGVLKPVSLALVLVTILLLGCRTAPPLPPVDLQAPGWSVRQGQAVWTAARGEAGVAGELLLATRTNGACWVQFSKPPFTLATARAEAGAWSVELLSARQHFGGRGPAPARFVWFALADVLGGNPTVGQASRLSQPSLPIDVRDRRDACPTPVGKVWRFDARGTEGWCLTNAVTGETLEGFLSP